MRPKHTETGRDGDREIQVGRDPRQMTAAELAALGHRKRPILDAIRQNCIECCSGNQAEVRRCSMIACPMWPYRMGSNPFVSRDYTEEQREAARTRLAAARTLRQSSS